MLFTGIAALLLPLASLVSAAPAASIEERQTGCSTLEVIYARGTLEPQGDGLLVGPAFHTSLALRVPGLSWYNVVYPATALFGDSSVVGAADMARRLQETAARCPNTRFVLSGYSQGVMVVHLANIPENLRSRIAAIVGFGDPFKDFPYLGRWPTATSNVLNICATGDPVCTRGPAGNNILAHIGYGGQVSQAVTFVAGRL